MSTKNVINLSNIKFGFDKYFLNKGKNKMYQFKFKDDFLSKVDLFFEEENKNEVKDANSFKNQVDNALKEDVFNAFENKINFSNIKNENVFNDLIKTNKVNKTKNEDVLANFAEKKYSNNNENKNVEIENSAKTDLENCLKNLKQQEEQNLVREGFQNPQYINTLFENSAKKLNKNSSNNNSNFLYTKIGSNNKILCVSSSLEDLKPY